MSSKIEIKLRDKAIYDIYRVDDNGDAYTILTGDNQFLHKLSDALKKEGL